jgi:arsenate reductase (thioredoxin)
MSEKTFGVLFLSRRNSARSLMAQKVLDRNGAGRFRSYSAASQPVAAIDPTTRRMLDELGYDSSDLRPKSWTEFARPGAPPLDFVFTLSDTVAGEPQPEWPGQPVTAHWHCDDPIRLAEDEEKRRRILWRVHTELETRLRIFANLPIASLDRMSLQARVREMASAQPDASPTGRSTSDRP